jgi:hypothetical protein
MKAVLFYEIHEDGVAKLMVHEQAHRARLAEFQARGVLLLAGILAQPPEGSMAIFTERSAALEFATNDPFVIEGVVSRWHVVDLQEMAG